MYAGDAYRIRLPRGRDAATPGRPAEPAHVAGRSTSSGSARAPRTAKWAVTIAATALSAYALDGIASAAGVALAASHLLRGLDQVLLVMFLVGTYVVWGAGLRVNLKANWALLEETGTSTNALSKAAYDLTRLRSCSPRARKLASAIGYVGTELAKEAPYYAGVFGAVLFSSSVSSKDALIFLGGANLGAAVYEYGLARMTRAFLRLRSRSRDGSPAQGA
jgi:hypothetical protein